MIKKLFQCFSVLLVIAVIPFISTCFGMNNDSHAEQNKQLVIDFYNAAVNQKDYDAASQYLGARYIQHNPLVADGKEGLKTFIDFLKTNFPQAHNEIKHSYVDGDFVILHVHSVRIPNTLGRAIIDVFKVDNGKIVEHWDVIQDIPEKSANVNGMF